MPTTKVKSTKSTSVHTRAQAELNRRKANRAMGATYTPTRDIEMQTKTGEELRALAGKPAPIKAAVAKVVKIKVLTPEQKLKAKAAKAMQQVFIAHKGQPGVSRLARRAYKAVMQGL